MRNTFLAIAVIAALMLLTTALRAEGTVASTTNGPDWHYVWHDGHWWYWMPEKTWMVWTGSAWTPYRQFSNCGQERSGRSAVPYSTSYGSYDSPANGSVQPAYSGGTGAQPAYYGGSWGGPTMGSGSDYAGYGWSWGPGTAFRDGPGMRF
ncbi:MAG: hypothetical protein ACLQNE_21345 [Thermoguttaceae bacterium]